MLKKLSLIFTILILVFACSESGGPDGPGDTNDGFDRQAMLIHLADDIIIPAFQDFNTKISSLKTAAESFSTTPNEVNLEALQTSWLEAYKTWQYVEMFNIGKAEELQFVNFINIYPVTVADIEANITNGGYDLDHPNNHDAQGFPALDYLLYGIGADTTETLAKFTTDVNATGYITYLTDVVSKIEEITTTITQDWNGAYRDEFVNSFGNTATSSLNKLVNDYIFYYEKGLRANKVGIPAGVFSTDPLAGNVEAFYNQTVSKELALEALNAVEDFFNGKNYNTSTERLGFKAYLEFLDNTQLATAITTQIGVARTKINTLNDSFYQQVNDDNIQMTETFDELQKVVPYLKSDMLQAFNISVDFVDADGD